MSTRQKIKSKNFYSLTEIEKEYLPESYKKRLKKSITDPKVIGINMAKEAFEKVKKEISMK